MKLTPTGGVQPPSRPIPIVTAGVRPRMCEAAGRAGRASPVHHLAALVTTRLVARSMRSRVSAADARRPPKATRLANQMSEMTPATCRSVGVGSPPLSVRASRLDLIGGAVEFRGGARVCDGEGPCHGCRQPWVALPAVIQICGEALEPFQRCAVT